MGRCRTFGRTIMRWGICLALPFLAWACTKSSPTGIATRLKVIKAAPTCQGPTGQVFVFLQPDCPLSQDQTRTLADLAEDPRWRDFCFTGVFPGSLYQRAELEAFMLRYPCPYRLLWDPDLELARALGASVVPEVFVLNGQGDVMYQGAIDDWAIREGSKRQQPKEAYLKNALFALQRGEKPQPSKTEAVGCLLE